MIALAAAARAAWEWLKVAAAWVARNWYIPLFLAGAIIGWILTRGGSATPAKATKTELDAIKAQQAAQEVVATAGVDAAKAHVAEVHATKLAALSEQQKKEAEAYAEDPVALAGFLVRAASSN